MKTKFILILLVALLGSQSVNAQVDMMKSAEETARRLDELEGKSTPERRANGENSSRYEYPDNNRTPEENNRSREQWEYLFGTQMEYFKEGMDKFDTPETRCIFIMVIYLDTYLDLVKRTNETSEVETKCDGYALQLMALTASTSIMYCPESLSELSYDELDRIAEVDLISIVENEDNNQLVTNWVKKYKSILCRHVPRYDCWNYLSIEDLIWHFKPEYIVNQLLFIQRHMQALDCPE